MILIFSNYSDKSTVEVVKILQNRKADYIIISEEIKVKVIYINIQEESFILDIGGQKVDSYSIKSVWFRRNRFILSHNKYNNNLIDIESPINQLLNLETIQLTEYINYLFLKQTTTIGNNNTFYVNKIIQLQIAKEIGLKIPKSLIATEKNVVENLLSKTPLITKGIYESMNVINGKYIISSGPELICGEDLERDIDKVFFPSLFQEYCEKDFEIRSFYLHGKLYSMAIFSQNNEKTKIDFRNYDDENPNRMIPYKLNPITENRITKLMDKLQLDTGSIDLIKYKDEDVFLEVNPVGQFSFTSGLCNYQLEKIIADILVNGKREAKNQIS